MRMHSCIAGFRVRPLAACLAVVFGMGGSSAFAYATALAGQRAVFDPDAPPAAAARSAIPHGSTPPAQQRSRTAKSSRNPVIRVVDSCSDAALRQAITSAGNGDTVDMTMACSVITLTGGAVPILVDNLTLVGPGADALTIDGGASTGYYDRVFRHYGAGALAISGVTITDSTLSNSMDAKGGCIDSDGIVSLSDVKVSNCYAQAATNFDALGGAVYAKLGVKLDLSTITSSKVFSQDGFALGGAIFSNGYLDIERSTVSDSAAASGGATYSKGGGIAVANGDALLLYSTISNNQAAVAGGIYVGYSSGHFALVTNSTISANNASQYVGGALLSIPATISNSTFASNTAVYTFFGIGVHAGNMLTAQSSIFSNNLTPAGDFGLDVYITSGAIDGEKNIIVHTPSTVPPDTITACPRLGPLADNGGPTLTHELLPGSPAIDAGSNPLFHSFDQRLDGFNRVFGAGADIGAFEWQGDLQDTIFTSRFEIACD